MHQEEIELEILKSLGKVTSQRTIADEIGYSAGKVNYVLKKLVEKGLVKVDRFVNSKTLEATQKYLELAKDYGVSPVTLAVSYSKHFDFVASTIIGARKSEQLEDSFKAFDFKIDDILLGKIEEIQKEILYPMG